MKKRSARVTDSFLLEMPASFIESVIEKEHCDMIVLNW